MVFAYWELLANFLLGLAWPLVVGLLGLRFGSPLLRVIADLGDRAENIPTPWGPMTLREVLDQNDRLKRPRDKGRETSIDGDGNAIVSGGSEAKTAELSDWVDVISDRVSRSDLTIGTRGATAIHINMAFAKLSAVVVDVFREELKGRLTLTEVFDLDLSSNTVDLAKVLYKKDVISSSILQMIETLASVRNSVVHGHILADFGEAQRYLKDVEYCMEELRNGGHSRVGMKTQPSPETSTDEAL